ncbi:protein SHI RELATED SEQUENCE 2-like [Panicum virgatum]|uniref:Uncharacterized protein n=1 Tax=Panicum virgatum TaxID=38727 RepID=A0A8T0VI14_PANVG|nr:protein SHI RELATED SEQUENCE 2-like [Panicum virgatum]KAG2636401.1 hypothetical protein PVAP13_2NG448500 [Panicum virgatum]
MHPDSDAASFLSTATSADGSLERQRQLVRGAASSSPPPRGTLAGGIIRCRDCWLLAKAGCAHRRCRHCCGGRGFACPAHVRPSSSSGPASPCSERHQRALAAPAASASTVAVEIRCNPHKRPRAPAATPSTSSVDDPTAAAAPGRFARDGVCLDAVFRRVRLGPDGAEVAYHATVTIGGRVFRGILYDVGPRSSSTASTDTGGSSEGSSRSTAGGGLDLTLRL